MKPSEREAWTKFVKQRETAARVHQRFEQIERAYVAALAGRDPASVNIRTLLPEIFRLVPDTSVEEVVAMLRWSARKSFREADALEARRRR